MVMRGRLYSRPAVLIATTNPGKLREIRRVLGDLGMPLRTLADFPPLPEPEETGRTFAENALLKATYYARSLNLPTVAEDSGLAIDALGGRPGVESARYPGATYPDKFANLYRELAPFPHPWTARFVCSLVFVDPARLPAGDPIPGGEAGVLFAAEATVDGQIAQRPAGTFGFGYDPIFFYPPYGTTLGNVADEQKLAVAHRGQAFRAFAAWLRAGGAACLAGAATRDTPPVSGQTSQTISRDRPTSDT